MPGADLVLERSLASVREELHRLEAKPVYMLGKDELFRLAWSLLGVLEQLASRGA